MRALILVEHSTSLLPSVRHLVTAAREAAIAPSLLLTGEQALALGHEACRIDGVREVLVCAHPALNEVLAEHYADLVLTLAKEYQYILAPATTFGKNILPRVAACLDVAMVSDVIAFKSMDTFVHPVYAGNALETVRLTSSPKILTIRTTAFNPTGDGANEAPIRKIDFTPAPHDVTFIESIATQSDRPSLQNARVVVSGGRGLQSKEQFGLVMQLADCLGAAVGASRAAVDAGFVPNDMQVGQTGQIVAPELYIALGISGAIQHVAGMKDAKVIVAINKDRDAPIFQIANYGLVGDVFTVVPELIEKLGC